ncbi:aldo/keto reductase [Streptomyces sp. NPDC090080]|uniref:aldo/keto reductase n=1 Tax=Streptomyces sp. NPDC090080 TaxID=3365939 RepID=UPI0038006AFD
MSLDNNATPAAAAGSVLLGGDMPISRIGLGTRQLTGRGVWGPPRDRAEAIRVVRRAVELGVNFIDTADMYGPYVCEELIREALSPYSDDLIIATKGGLTHPSPDEWRPLGRPEYLRQQAELSLRHLGLERIPLYQLHRIDPRVPLADQLGELKLLQEAGKIHHVGLCEVSVDQLKQAQAVLDIVCVQNLYHLFDRTAEDVLQYAVGQSMVFIPWYPLAAGDLARGSGPLAAAASEHGITPAQLALSWLLRVSPATVCIPGTSQVSHLEENAAAASVCLTDAVYASLPGYGLND